jgi:glycosyltransferase involved in cell wall biosynthesis
MGKVSIIIPIYNVENYIEKTIDSAIKQTEHDIEIILVDDGSTDHSGCICDEFANVDARIRVVHKENGGLSSARNAGTQIATSEYVMYLDGDDYLKENAVERVLQMMREYPSDFIQFMYQEVEDGKEPSAQTEFGQIYQAHTSRELFENLYCLGGVAASGATKLFRRELMLEIPFESIRHEDEMWCTRAFQKDLTVTYISDELYYYVMRDGSIIHSSFNRKRFDSFTVSEERIQTLQLLGYNDLLSLEYKKMFGIILTLYREAKEANDDRALRVIKDKFLQQKNNIKKYRAITGKFALLFYFMCLNFSAINLYVLYWKWCK